MSSFITYDIVYRRPIVRGAKILLINRFDRQFGGSEKRTERETDNLLLIAPPESKSEHGL